MGIGKYSPTVSFSYRKSQKWWDQHQTDANSWYDQDGYDSYGYNAEGKDRAGYTEEDYGNDGRYDHYSDCMVYDLHEHIESEWAGRWIPGLSEELRKGVNQ